MTVSLKLGQRPYLIINVSLKQKHHEYNEGIVVEIHFTSAYFLVDFST